MGAVSLATLRARARERADMVGSSFVADTATSLDAWLNEGAQILHDKLVEAYGSEYLEKSTTATTTTATDYALPSDFYKLLGVDLLDDVAPRLADRLARLVVWVDSKVVHVDWLASFAPPRTA
jgi:hypothetical protein